MGMAPFSRWPALLSFLALLSVQVLAKAQQIPSPSLDLDFIGRSLDKTVLTDPSPDAGYANCAATALRAGKFLPVFALNDPQSFYDQDLPGCFQRLSPDARPRAGDLGVLVSSQTRQFMHVVLFLDSSDIFQKLSYNERDLFQLDNWKHVQNLMSRAALPRSEIWRFQGGNSCVFTQLTDRYKALPPTSVIRQAGQEIEDRLLRGDWDSPSRNLTPEILRQALQQTMMESSNNSNDARWIRFETQILNLLLHTPAFASTPNTAI